MSDQHETPIKTPKQLITIVGLAFVVPVMLIIMVVYYVRGGLHVPANETPDAVAKRIKPVGELSLVDANAPKVVQTGEQIFTATCATCHGAGLAGAPKVGDKAAWGKLIASGQKTLLEHAIKGIRAMPPRGGNPDLTDVEVERAVVYMANQSGATWKEPAAPANAAPATAAAPAAAPAAAAPAAGGEKVAAADKGKSVYDSTCMACHTTGAAGAPKIGDKAAWAARLKAGKDAMYTSALKGKNAMPAKGGNASLPDDDVKAAVDYVLAQSK